MISDHLVGGPFEGRRTMVYPPSSADDHLTGAEIHGLLLITPLLVLLAVLCGIAIGLWLGTLNVRYRDVGDTRSRSHAAPDIRYPGGLPTEPHQERGGRAFPFFVLSPLTGIVEGFRWAVLGVPGEPPLFMLAVSLIVTASIDRGFAVFPPVENTFADMVALLGYRDPGRRCEQELPHRPSVEDDNLREPISDACRGLFRRGRRDDSPPDAARASSEEFWALEDVSFEVGRGEVSASSAAMAQGRVRS